MHNDWGLYEDSVNTSLKKASDIKTKEDIYDYYLSNGMKNLYMIVDKIINHLGYPFSEMVSDDLEEIALISLWKVSEKYDSSICDNFEPFFVNCLKRKFFSYATTQMCSGKKVKPDSNKRVSIQNIVSIEMTTCNKSGKELTIGDTLRSSFDIFNEAFPENTDENATIEKLKEGLSKTEKNVIQLIADGYDRQDICDILGIKREKYNRVINNIRSYPELSEKFEEILHHN